MLVPQVNARPIVPFSQSNLILFQILFLFFFVLCLFNTSLCNILISIYFLELYFLIIFTFLITCRRIPFYLVSTLFSLEFWSSQHWNSRVDLFYLVSSSHYHSHMVTGTHFFLYCPRKGFDKETIIKVLCLIPFPL